MDTRYLSTLWRNLLKSNFGTTRIDAWIEINGQRKINRMALLTPQNSWRWSYKLSVMVRFYQSILLRTSTTRPYMSERTSWALRCSFSTKAELTEKWQDCITCSITINYCTNEMKVQFHLPSPRLPEILFCLATTGHWFSNERTSGVHSRGQQNALSLQPDSNFNLEWYDSVESLLP